MKTKLVYVLVLLAMVIAIGVGVWVMLAPRQLEPIKKYVATSLKDDNLTEITETTETSASAKNSPGRTRPGSKRDVSRANGVCRC